MLRRSDILYYFKQWLKPAVTWNKKIKTLFTSASEDVFQKLLVGKDDLNTRKPQ